MDAVDIETETAWEPMPKVFEETLKYLGIDKVEVKWSATEPGLYEGSSPEAVGGDTHFVLTISNKYPEVFKIAEPFEPCDWECGDCKKFEFTTYKKDFYNSINQFLGRDKNAPEADDALLKKYPDMEIEEQEYIFCPWNEG